MAPQIFGRPGAATAGSQVTFTGMVRRWTPWAWMLAAAASLVWNLWLGDVIENGWINTIVAVACAAGFIILPIAAARRADLRQARSRLFESVSQPERHAP